jgi:hypothetical protein
MFVGSLARTHRINPASLITKKGAPWILHASDWEIARLVGVSS